MTEETDFVEDENEQVSNEEIMNFINSDEFKNSLAKASKSKLNVMVDLAPEMRSIKTEFIDYILQGANVKDDDKKEFIKKQGKVFKKLVDYVHFTGGTPRPDSPAKLDVLADEVEIALKYLDFAKNTDFRDLLAKRGIYIDDTKSKKLTDDYPLLNPESWENYKTIIDGGNGCQTDICANNDEIKGSMFEEAVPEEYRYSRENKNGIKPSTFTKLVTAYAMKSTKDEEKMQKYLTNLNENSLFNIAREEILQEGYKQIEE